MKFDYYRGKLIYNIRKDISERANELINCGNSREKSFGCGMIHTLEIIESHYKNYKKLNEYFDNSEESD
jgi:hypothetical protein